MIDSEFVILASKYLDMLVCNDDYEYVDEVDVDKVLLLIQFMLGAYLSTLEPFKDTEMKVLDLLQGLMDK